MNLTVLITTFLVALSIIMPNGSLAAATKAIDAPPKELIGVVLNTSGSWRMSLGNAILPLRKGDPIYSHAVVQRLSKDGSLEAVLLNGSKISLPGNAYHGEAIVLESKPTNQQNNVLVQYLLSLINQNSDWVNPVSRDPRITRGLIAS